MPPIDDDEDDRPRSRGRSRDDDFDDRDDEDRPRRRRRDDDDDDFDDDRPRKKKKSSGTPVALIIVIIVVVVLGCGGILLIGLLLPAVTKVREAAARATEMNNLKQMGVGMHNYASVNGKLPPAEGPVSVRVHLLPYIEQDPLFTQFDVTQPWNAGRNAAAGAIPVKTYLSPLDENPGMQTHYRTFVGPSTINDPELIRKAPFSNYITDGTANTAMFIETADTVAWPEPREITFSRTGSLPEFGHPKRTVALICLADGSVRSFDKKKMSTETMRALITANGGETINPDW
jgi:hypothetical protein